MKTLLVMALCVAVLLSAGVARADDPSGTLDPVQATDILGFNLIEKSGVNYDVTWTGCGLAQVINYSAFQSSSACIYFVNLTGAPIHTLDFSFNDSGIPGPFTCLSADSYLSAPCIADQMGNVVTMDYSGGTPIPYTAPIPTIFIFGLSGDDASGSPISPQEANMDFSAGTGANVPTYDPGTLMLLATGIGLLGMCGLRRRPA